MPTDNRSALTLTRQQATELQIATAIELFHANNFACAITLALAGEGQMQAPKSGPYLLTSLRDAAKQRGMSDKYDAWNELRNWLKHTRDVDIVEISPRDAFVAIVRAISKFHALYGMTPVKLERFVEWSRAHGYVEPPGRAD